MSYNSTRALNLRAIILLALVIHGLGGYAQMVNGNPIPEPKADDYNTIYSNNHDHDLFKKKNVKSLHVNIDYEGSDIYKVYFFNKAGSLDSSYTMDEDSVVHSKKTINHSPDQIEHIGSSSNGFTKTTIFQLDDSNNVVEEKVLNNEKVHSIRKYDYANGLLDSMRFYLRGQLRVSVYHLYKNGRIHQKITPTEPDNGVTIYSWKNDNIDSVRYGSFTESGINLDSDTYYFLTYNDSGLMTSTNYMNHGDLNRTDFVYNDLGMLTEIVKYKNGQKIESWEYQYKDGLIIKEYQIQYSAIRDININSEYHYEYYE